MKLNMLDVLIYIFKNYITNARMITDADSLSRELEAAGFQPEQIEHAFVWLDRLMNQSNDEYAVAPSNGTRIFDRYEIEKISMQCRSLLILLSENKVISATLRERVIDQAMELDVDEINLTHLKQLFVLNMFKQPESEQAILLIRNLADDSITQH